jgi:hypothetical protein
MPASVNFSAADCLPSSPRAVSTSFACESRNAAPQIFAAGNGTRDTSLRMRRVPPSVAAAAIAVALSASAALLGARAANADELTLKDGTKIIGTIVGFEAKSFRVKTSYGFAEVQRDQVVSISIAEAAKPVSPAENPKPVLATPAPEPNAKPAASANPAAQDAKSSALPTKSESAHEVKSAPGNASTTKPAASAAKPATSSAKTPAPAAASRANSKPSSATIAAPSDAKPSAEPSAASVDASKPAALAPIHEEVSGNVYTNETYHFEMYKPPDWEIIDGARSILPGAIAAMGTEDATTYLLVGQEPSAKSLAGAMDATEDRLENVMENYRPLGQERVTVSGSSAIAQHFRGSVDEHDWSGVVVLVPHGSHVYAIFGMTRADNDLVQIEENVIARTISSFQFYQ